MRAVDSLALFLCSITVAAAEPCKPIAGLEPLLRPGTVLLLGELHGTAESPAFALDVACHAAVADLSVVLALELPKDEQGLVDTFLSSKGAETDRTALLAGARWRSSYQDGRTSEAMFDVIDGARKLRAKKPSLRVALFDMPTGAPRGQRDREMGHNLARIVGEAKKAMVISLSGNIHSRITKGSARNRDFEPMGYVLKQAAKIDRLVSLDVAHGPGSAWICAPDCGTVELGGRQPEYPWSIEIDDETRPAGHSGWYRVGGITASPPAHPAQRAKAKMPAPRPAESTPAPPAATANVEPSPEPIESDQGIQGKWQAYDYASDSRTWVMQFDGAAFHAEAGADDWYKGEILVHPGHDPAWIDLRIDDCRCSFKEMTSQGIYYWDDGSLVIAAPTPGKPRPRRFNENNGEMMRLRKLD
jgi:uncharacterized protein (TIGR03067 family)